MSTRNLSGAESPSCSSSVRLRTTPTSSSVLTLLLSCQRQSFHFSSGTSCHSGARRLTAGCPSGPRALAWSRGLTHSASVAATPAAWWAAATWISRASTRSDLLKRRASSLRTSATHKVYALCMSADHSARVLPGPADRRDPGSTTSPRSAVPSPAMDDRSLAETLAEHVAANREAWDRWAPDFEPRGRRAWADPVASGGIWNVPEPELALLPDDLAGRDAIELGCGTASVSAWLARLGARPVGIDNSPNQLATARMPQAEHALEFPLLPGHAAARPHPDPR